MERLPVTTSLRPQQLQSAWRCVIQLLGVTLQGSLMVVFCAQRLPAAARAAAVMEGAGAGATVG